MMKYYHIFVLNICTLLELQHQLLKKDYKERSVDGGTTSEPGIWGSQKMVHFDDEKLLYLSWDASTNSVIYPTQTARTDQSATCHNHCHQQSGAISSSRRKHWQLCQDQVTGCGP